MSFDAAQLNAAIARHDTVWRVVVAATKGSIPREVGAAMLVWDGGQSGTIGGGALEFEAAAAARRGRVGKTTHPLGPSLGQCCGGHVTLVTECFDAPVAFDEGLYTRAIGHGDRPLALRAYEKSVRNGSSVATLKWADGWLSEPVAPARLPVWIWGAGHVGRAVVHILASLPHITLTWIDTQADRFPADIAEGVTQLVAVQPDVLMKHAPPEAHHLIFTYSHALDLALCHGALTHGFGRCGLIGSATKWVRFQKRLRDLGHEVAAISQIECPIGDPRLGKHPSAIAVSVAHSLLLSYDSAAAQRTAL